MPVLELLATIKTNTHFRDLVAMNIVMSSSLARAPIVGGADACRVHAQQQQNQFGCLVGELEVGS